MKKLLFWYKCIVELENVYNWKLLNVEFFYVNIFLLKTFHVIYLLLIKRKL